MRRALWTDLVLPNESWHFTRRLCKAGTPVVIHDHDFAEVFWVEEGSGLHELNGKEEAIPAGTLVFMRPKDRHAFRTGHSYIPFVLSNFAVSWKTASGLSRRWREHRLPRVPWAEGAGPARWNLSREQLSSVISLIRQIENDPPSHLAGDRFLAGLIHVLHRTSDTYTLDEGAPEWLRRALVDFQKPERLAAGIGAFFRLAGRSREHVARACRRHTGVTPTEIFLRFRIEHATRLLQRTDLPVIEVAAEAGFGNLSLFHRRFRAATGLTPLHYRRSSQASLPGARQS